MHLSTPRPDARYAELHAHSAFTFLDGVDQPGDLARAAHGLGLDGIAVLDVDGMYSAIQTSTAARDAGIPTVFGAELTLDRDQPLLAGLVAGAGLPPGAEDPGIRLPVLVGGPDGYHALCAAMSRHVLDRPGTRAPAHDLEELASHHRGDWTILTGTARGPLRRALAHGGPDAARDILDRLTALFGRDHVAVESALAPTAGPALADQLAELAAEARLRLVATTAARCASPRSLPLSDVLAATRANTSLLEHEPHLPALRSFLRTPQEMLRIHHRHPGAVAAAADLAADAAFDLSLVAPRLPKTDVPDGHTDATWLRHLTYEGVTQRYGTRAVRPDAWDAIEHELEVIEQLDFPGYFLIVKEIVDFCRSQGILCQGRGSAANSAVCYALGITAVDAVANKMMFERFLSPGRAGYPDIDLDIEAIRREEVIQHVYARYGRDRAAQVANVISYRPRSAIRDAARALGYEPGVAQAWSSRTSRWRWEGKGDGDADRDPSMVPERVRDVAAALQRLPRHMGIHPGGMVLTETPVSEVCPITWAAMENRTVLQWDKDDCEDAGLVKFDLLGLGMLTALRRAFDWLAADGVVGVDGRPLTLYNLPPEQPRVYDLLCAADTVGVFQVESRAQMNTLPRLKPRKFYDIVVEVALIRPGPIQGHAVNPYLRRRNGREEVSYLHPLLKPALEKTMGVPLFQEQLMQIAVDVAGFTPAQADQLRRAMGSKRSPERMEALRPSLFAGMQERGVPEDVCWQVFEQLKGFSDFGFPESHSFSFAYIVYASAWLKVFHPEHFYAGVLASQPMGFYSPATLVSDARRHGVRVLPCDVNASSVGASVQEIGTGGGRGAPSVTASADAPTGGPAPVPSAVVGLEVRADLAIRLGFESIKGLGEAGERIVSARQADGPFADLRDLAVRAHLSSREMELLARAGATDSLGVGRRAAMWAAEAVGQGSWHQPYLPGTEVGVEAPELAEMTAVEELQEDYRATGLSTTTHPFGLVRDVLAARGVMANAELGGAEDATIVTVAGVVTHRQRPHTARGVTFLSLEDETGLANITCSPGLWERYRTTALTSQALLVRGMIEKADGVVNVIAHHLEEVRLPVSVRSRDFR